jgi:aminoglycoside phosphotransferase (APT) family kinase protein
MPAKGRTGCALRLAAEALPFAGGTFDSIVVDFNSNALRQNARAGTLREVQRVMRPGGRCLILASTRRIPRNWRNWRQYYLAPPDRVWRELLTSDAGFTISNTTFARLDSTRIIELTAPDMPPSVAGAIGDSRVMILDRSGESGERPFLEKLTAELERSLDSSPRPVRLERFLIRKIGKTTLVVAGSDERRYVVRVARTPIAVDRGRRNFETLETLRSTDLISSEMKSMVPRPRIAGTIDGYPYYVEELLAGTARDNYRGWPPSAGWEPGALRFITEMHLATKRLLQVDREVFARFVTAPLDRIDRRCAKRDTSIAIDALKAVLECAFVGETLPVVWSHGDFSAGNCLYDRSRRLSAVVDWELFSTDHLPLLDILNVMEIPGERNAHPRWQRFDAIRTLLLNRKAPELPALRSYLDRMDIPQRVLPALSVMYWVDHVAKRIDARAGDSVWMQKRVLQPMAALSSAALS